ncbi:MAG: hypothetical protein JSV70_03095, partial [bacterium]
MRGNLGLLLLLTAVLIVGGCGGTGSQQSSALTFEMAVLQDNGPYSIFGTVYNDFDGDGVMNDGAGGVAGAVVILVGTGLEETTETDGMFDFNVSTAGAYTVTVMAPLGYAITTSDEIGVLVEGEGEYGPVLFGLQLVEEVPVVDVKPGSDVNPLNLRSNGVLPVAILGSEGFGVMDVDPESLRLERIAPLRWSYEDVCCSDGTTLTDPYMDDDTVPDGFADLTLKFSTQEIADAILGAPGDVSRGDTVTLTM